jgi:hypothetical protein
MSNLAKILTLPAQPGAQERPRVDPATGERRARWVMLAILAGALGFFALGAYLDVQDEADGINELTPANRLSLYQRTLDEVQTPCRESAASSGALRDHCVAQARFVEQFPECTDACRRSANAILPHARR